MKPCITSASLLESGMEPNSPLSSHLHSFPSKLLTGWSAAQPSLHISFPIAPAVCAMKVHLLWKCNTWIQIKYHTSSFVLSKHLPKTSPKKKKKVSELLFHFFPDSSTTLFNQLLFTEAPLQVSTSYSFQLGNKTMLIRIYHNFIYAFCILFQLKYPLTA